MAGLASERRGRIGDNVSDATIDRRGDGETESKWFGLVSGLGPPATIHYHQALIDAHAALGRPARMVIAHAEMKRAVRLVDAGDEAGLADYLVSLMRRLAAAGAEFAAIPAVTPHLCMPRLAALSPLPLADIVEATIRRLRERGIHRLALLGTRFTMQSRLLGGLEGFDAVDLAPSVVDEVHRIYFTIADNGAAVPEDIAYLKDLGRALHRDAGAQAIIAAGTELSPVFQEGRETFPLLDCAEVHVEAIAERAMA